MILTIQNVRNVFQTSNCSKNFIWLSTFPNALCGRLCRTRNFQTTSSLYVAVKGLRIRCFGSCKSRVALRARARVYVCVCVCVCGCSSRHLIPLGANSAPCSSSFKLKVLRAWICISKAEEIYNSCNSYSIQYSAPKPK